jgi:hypothetical protein
VRALLLPRLYQICEIARGIAIDGTSVESLPALFKPRKNLFAVPRDAMIFPSPRYAL